MTSSRTMTKTVLVACAIATVVAVAVPVQATYLKQSASSCQALPAEGASVTQWSAPTVASNTGWQAGEMGGLAAPVLTDTTPVYSRILCSLPNSSALPASDWWGLGVHTYNPWADDSHAVKFRDCAIGNNSYSGYCGPRWSVAGEGYKATGVYIGASTNNHVWHDYGETGWPYLYVAIPQSTRPIDGDVIFSVLRGFEVWGG